MTTIRMEINVECFVEDCWIHHDMENEVINEKAREYAELIEDAVSNGQYSVIVV